MVENFWLNKKREKDFANKASEIAKYFQMELRDLFSKPYTQRYEFLDKYLKASEKNKKKVKQNV